MLGQLLVPPFKHVHPNTFTAKRHPWSSAISNALYADYVYAATIAGASAGTCICRERRPSPMNFLPVPPGTPPAAAVLLRGAEPDSIMNVGSLIQF